MAGKGASQNIQSGSASGRRELLEQNPIAWIVARDRWAANVSRVTVALIVLLLAMSIISYGMDPPTPIGPVAPVI